MMSNEKLQVLLVEDNPGDVDLVRVYLAQEPHDAIELSHVPSLGAARAAMDLRPVDLVLLDLGLPDGSGVEVVVRMRQMAAHVPIVVLTGRDDAESGLEALKRDAQDYLVKDQLDAAKLRRSIRYAVERHRWQQQYRHQLSVSPDGMIVLDEMGRVRFANAAAIALLGEEPKTVESLPEEIRLTNGSPADATLRTGRTVEARSVETLWQGQLACLVTLRDTTERHRLTEELRVTNERLEQLVSTDPLTEVLNRRGAEEALGKELGRVRRTGENLVAILIDYDDFKGVNDGYGHAVGDAALRALTENMRDALRAGDHIARVGGDEFLVLLPETTVKEGFAVAEKLRQTIKATALPVADGSLGLSASFAVGSVDPETVALEQIIGSLTRALKRSKEAGKDRVCTATEAHASERDDADPPGLHEFDVASLDLAIVLHPIRRVDSEEVVGFEALTRGPRGAYSMPADLFRTAFERNLLTALDLRALAASLSVLRRGDLHGSYHVNVFPSTILNTPTDRIVRQLQDGGREGRLCVELSEQQFLGDPTYLKEPLTALRINGIRVAIDDVGFGRSSLEALLVLEPDVVKVDRSCIQAVDRQPGKRRQLERLTRMLAAIDADVIVEGVETAGELRVLRDMGVPHAQGFLWDAPTRTDVTS